MVASTGALLLHDVVGHAQPVDELVEVPLMGAMFLAMVWHAQRRRSTMESLRQVSDANLRLLRRERQFVQDASHELRTPITVALGHAELVERASREPEVAEDARIVVDELQRLRRLADRLLLLATSEDPDFLSPAPIEVEQLLQATLQRWAPVDRRWRLGPTGPATVVADADRLELAVDALVENAVKHTGPDDEIRLGTRRQDGLVAIVVGDRPGPRRHGGGPQRPRPGQRLPAPAAPGARRRAGRRPPGRPGLDHLTSRAFWSDVHQRKMPQRRANAYGKPPGGADAFDAAVRGGHGLPKIIGGEVGEFSVVEVAHSVSTGLRSDAYGGRCSVTSQERWDAGC